MPYVRYTINGAVRHEMTDFGLTEFALAVPDAKEILVQDAPFVEVHGPQALVAIEAQRASKEAGGFTFNGKTFACDPASVARLSAAKMFADHIEAASPGAFAAEWPAADGSAMMFDHPGIKGLGAALGQHLLTAQTVALKAKARVAAAKTAAQIDVVLAGLGLVS